MRRSEVWLINLDPSIGAEIRKTRPTLRVIGALTEWKERYAEAPWMVCVRPRAANGLDKESAADAFQVRSVARGYPAAEQ